MIEKEAFLAGMAVLAGSFGREVDAGVQRAYYVVLNPHLTTEEFERAVSVALTTETYWPSPAVLLGKVKQDAATSAIAALEHIKQVTGRHGGYRFLPHEVYHTEFDAPTRAAISAVGGLFAIGNTGEERWPSLQKKFAAAYAASLMPQAPRLASPVEEPKVKQLTAQTARVLSISGRDRAAGDT